MNFDLDTYVRDFNHTEVFKRFREILESDRKEIELKEELLEVIKSTHGGVVLIIGPYGAGKTTLRKKVLSGLNTVNFNERETLNTLQDRASVLSIEEFGGLFNKNRNFLEPIIEAGWTVVGESHPPILMNGIIDALPKPLKVVERPLLRDELVKEILEEVFDFPEAISTKLTELVAGSVHPLVQLMFEIQRAKIKKEYDYKELGITNLLSNIETRWANFAERELRNYEEIHICGQILQNIALATNLLPVEDERIQIFLRMGLVKLDNNVIKLRSPAWAKLIQERNEKESSSEFNPHSSLYWYMHLYIPEGDYYPFIFID